MGLIRIPKLELSKTRIPLPKQRARVHTNEDLKVYDRKKMKQNMKKDITERLDRVAGEIETAHPKLALAVDLISDHLEQRVAFTGVVEQAVKEFTDYLVPIVTPAKKTEIKTKVHDFAQEIYDAPIMTASENPMLIENSLMKIDKDLKNMKSWFENIEVASLRERLESIHGSLSKHIEDIKGQFKK